MVDQKLGHKQWLDQEYAQWKEALGASTVHNFRDHPTVKRMLGEVAEDLFSPELSESELDTLLILDNLGRVEPRTTLSGTALRMAHYAQRVLTYEPSRIVEVGGGVGQFYATLRAFDYRGSYCSLDLPDIKIFQRCYLKEVARLTRMNLKTTSFRGKEFFCSFYALGEFDDATKTHYVEQVIRKCPHGFVIWNPHSGASSTVPFPCLMANEQPLTHEGNMELVW